MDMQKFGFLELFFLMCNSFVFKSGVVDIPSRKRMCHTTGITYNAAAFVVYVCSVQGCRKVCKGGAAGLGV